MTKEVYYDMCEALGADPIESEIPIEFDDLILDVQESLIIYNGLQDNWDSMSGRYLGKNFSGLSDILELYNVEDKRTTFNIIRKIDDIRSNILAAKAKKPAK